MVHRYRLLLLLEAMQNVEVEVEVYDDNNIEVQYRNRAEDRYEEEAYNPDEEGQHVFQSLSPD